MKTYLIHLIIFVFSWNPEYQFEYQFDYWLTDDVMIDQAWQAGKPNHMVEQRGNYLHTLMMELWIRWWSCESDAGEDEG